MNVADFERRSFSVQAARAQRGKFSLVSEFRNGVGLIHELGKLRRPEEFFDRARNRSYVDKSVGSDILGILRGHSFFDNPFKTIDADSELVLQKFADRPYSTIAEVVDIIYGTDTVIEVAVQRNGSDYIVRGYMLMIEFVDERFDVLLLLAREFFGNARLNDIEEGAAREYEPSAEFSSLFLVFLILGLNVFACGSGGFFHVEKRIDSVEIFFRNVLDRACFNRFGKFLGENVVGIINIFDKPERSGRNACDRFEIDYIVTDDFMFFVAVHESVNDVYAAVLNEFRLFGRNCFALFDEKFAVLVHDIFVSDDARKSYADVKAFVELISAHSRAVVSSRVEEKIFKMLTNGFLGGNFARTKPSVKFEKTFAFGLGDVLVHSGKNHRVVLENFLYALVRSEPESAEKNGRGEFTRSVDLNPQSVVGVLLELYPRASVGDNRRAVKFSARFGELEPVVYARRTNELRNDNAFRAVYDKRTVLGHLGKFAHEYVLIENFARDLVHEPDFYF